MPNHAYSWIYLELNSAFFQAKKLTKCGNFAKKWDLHRSVVYESVFPAQSFEFCELILPKFQREVGNEVPSNGVKHCWVKDRV